MQPFITSAWLKTGLVETGKIKLETQWYKPQNNKNYNI